MTRTKFRALAAALVAVLIVSAGMVGGVSAQTVEEPNYSSDMVGDQFIDEDRLDIAAWNASEMDSVKMAYDDAGEAQPLPIEFNDSEDASANQIAYALDNVEVDDFGIFPRKDVETDNEASALDASEWTTDESSTAGSGTVSDVTTAAGVDAVEIATSSQTAGDTFVASYSNFSIDTDAPKRVAMIGVNVDVLETDTEATIAFVDSDGDTKELLINSSLSAGADDVIANQTGDGYFTQEKLADLPTEGSGDGTLDGIEHMNVTVTDGNVDADVFMSDVEKKGEITLGEEKVDTDDDDELETETFSEVITPGEIEVHSIDSLPPMFDDAIIHDLGLLEVQWTSSAREATHNRVTYSDAEAYGGYETQGEYYTRLEIYSWIDLTHHNPVLKAEQPLVTERYKRFAYVEDAGDDTDFDELESFTDVVGSLQGEGETFTVDDSIQPGQAYVLTKTVVYQKGELQEVQQPDETVDEGSSGFWGGNNPISGFLNWAIAGMGAVATAVLGLFKIRG